MPAAERNVTAAVKQRILSGWLLNDNAGDTLLGGQGQVGSRARKESQNETDVGKEAAAAAVRCVFRQRQWSDQPRGDYIRFTVGCSCARSLGSLQFSQ